MFSCSLITWAYNSLNIYLPHWSNCVKKKGLKTKLIVLKNVPFFRSKNVARSMGVYLLNSIRSSFPLRRLWWIAGQWLCSWYILVLLFKLRIEYSGLVLNIVDWTSQHIPHLWPLFCWFSDVTEMCLISSLIVMMIIMFLLLSPNCIKL